ncbi:MAG: S9 family peptidase [Candidatus Aminicenantes bacterium]|nr:MAG: S9 family peptidase [Candidatus Aminicenantes bacterium]
MKSKYNIFAVVLIFTLAMNCRLFPVEPRSQAIDRWLMLGPVKIPDIEKELLGDDKNILDFNHITVPGLLPLEGGNVPWAAKRVMRWTVLKNPDFAGYETGVLYLATYLEPSRWIKTTLNIHHTNLGASVFLDGRLIKAKLLKDKITSDLELTNEKHLLVLKILLLKGTKLKFKASLETGEPFQNERIAISLIPNHRVQPENILNVIDVTRVWVSPDGKRAAVSLKQTHKGTGKTERWVEILNTASHAVIFSSRNFGKISDFRWIGDSRAFSYTVTRESKTSIFQYNINTNSQAVILEDIKNFSNYWWADNKSFLVYCTYQKKDNSEHYKYIKEIPDRAEFSAYRYSMFIYFPFAGTGGGAGTTHQVSDEEQNFQSAIISPDSKYVLMTRAEKDYKNRPYSKKCFFRFDVSSLSIKPLMESNWINTVTWSPDSKKLLVLGGPSAFNGMGKNLEEGKIPNDYDTQAYIYDLNTKKSTAISKHFNPSIKNASWSSPGNNIYFVAADKADVGIFKYFLKSKKYRRLSTKVDVVKESGFAAKRNMAVYWGSSAAVPFKLYLLNLSTGNASVLKDYNKDDFKYVKIGTVKEWDFKTGTGKTITGRIHYPPDFDPTRKYPCIVYYYGGTSPVTRDFGGRYPKNWYAANGYLVYVLQPSGAVGFGQEFSSVHVNDWGKVTSEEIITGVKQLIKEHKYIDPQRIGAMGASYGGFMTQYLAAHTDIFAAYISHAGISSLASYWGIGDWGYTYSGVASADSFPWNRKDLYVGHSPLFMAERITKPLLLLHGALDNNVPPGESYQMFAALKLQGKEVELITFKDQKHLILEYKKRLRWMRTIIAWWDKHLKNQPQHWEEMYR